MTNNKRKKEDDMSVRFFKNNTHPELVKDWQNFYQTLFKIKVDFSNLPIPEPRYDYDRLLILAQGITIEKLFKKCKTLFSCRKWVGENLDKIIDSERLAHQYSYAVWLKDNINPDSDLMLFSFQTLQSMPIKRITLQERLLFELKYYLETGKHLDTGQITYCAGSRVYDGQIPSTVWFDDKLMIGSFPSDSRIVNLCCRGVLL